MSVRSLPGLLLISFIYVARAEGAVLEVRFPAIDPAAAVWVAAVAEGEPWERPAAEMIAKGGAARLTVPAGRYRLAAGARGYVTLRDVPVEAIDGSTRTVTMPLQALHEISGAVVDANERPVEGARIGLLRAFVLDDPDAVSPKGEAHVAANELARSDADGIFHLPAHPDSRHLLWIEADGYAPAYLHGVTVANSSALARVTLGRGASLEVTAKNEGDAARLQLVPRNAALPQGATPNLARAIWTRAAAPRVSWISLPPGEYELWARSDGELPRSVLRVTLKAGEKASANIDLRRAARATANAPALTLAIAGEAEDVAASVNAGEKASANIDLRRAARASANAPALTLAIAGAAEDVAASVNEGEKASANIDLRRAAHATANAPALSLAIAGEAAPPTGEVRVTRWIGGETEDVAASVKAAAGGIAIELAGGCVDGATYVIAAPRWFATTPRIARGTCGAALRLDAIPRADGRVRLVSKKPLPRAGVLIAKPCTPRSPQVPPEIPFAIGPDGAASLLFPAGCSTPILQTSTAVPIHLGTTRAAGTKPHDFGSHALVEGGVLLVRLTGDDGMPLPARWSAPCRRTSSRTSASRPTSRRRSRSRARRRTKTAGRASPSRRATTSSPRSHGRFRISPSRTASAAASRRSSIRSRSRRRRG